MYKLELPRMQEMHISRAVGQYVGLFSGGNTEAVIGELSHRRKKYNVYTGIRSYTTLSDGLEFYVIVTPETRKDEDESDNWYGLYNISKRGVISFNDIPRNRRNTTTVAIMNQYCSDLLKLPLLFEYNREHIYIKHTGSGHSLQLRAGITLSTEIQRMGLYATNPTTWQVVSIVSPIQPTAAATSSPFSFNAIAEDPVRRRAEEGTFDPDVDIAESEIVAAED